jgi:hypothetical protein
VAQVAQVEKALRAAHHLHLLQSKLYRIN